MGELGHFPMHVIKVEGHSDPSVLSYFFISYFLGAKPMHLHIVLDMLWPRYFQRRNLLDDPLVILIFLIHLRSTALQQPIVPEMWYRILTDLDIS